MRITLLLIASFLIAAPVHADEPKPSTIFQTLAPYVVLGVGNGLDLHTSRQAFQRGGTEINPLTGSIGSSVAGITVLKIGMTAALALEMRWLSQHGHPKAAKVLGYGVGSGMALIALHNRSVMR